MWHFHCRAIHYDCHDCPFVADHGISLKFWVLIQRDAGRYVLIRFIALGYDMITIAQFLMTRSGTSFRYDQIRLDRIVLIGPTMGSRPDTIIVIEVHDLGRCDAYIPSDAFISDRYALL